MLQVQHKEHVSLLLVLLLRLLLLLLLLLHIMPFAGSFYVSLPVALLAREYQLAYCCCCCCCSMHADVGSFDVGLPMLK
jgi:hypothetical protein